MYGMGYVAICVIFALLGGWVAHRKGNSFWVWFLVSGVLPGLGLIAAILSRSEHDELRRQCPGCGRVVKISQAICLRCGTELDFPDVAIAPESTVRRARRR